MMTEEQVFKEEERLQKIANANVRTLLETRQGKEFIWNVLSLCDIYSSIPGEFEAGKRQVGLEVMQMLDDADVMIYPNLLIENRKNV